LNPKLRATNP